jgi:hypothetical protein
MEGSFGHAPALDDDKAASARRNALICTLLLALCVLAAYPVAREGYLDDFSYAATSLEFLRTGHIIYNSWSAPTEGWMIAWGALFIKLFGFSFFTLRMANLPFALASVYLFHRILARFGISQRNASLGALTLGLAPVFFPVAISFMTDVPGLFVLLLCVYMCQRAVVTTGNKAAILWLVSAALLNVAGGTVRQTAWLGALVVVPATGLLLRKRRGVLLASVASALMGLVFVVALMHWFYSRPNMFVDPATKAALHYSARDLLRELTRLFLCLLLLILPLLAAWWPTVRTFTRWALLRILAVLGLMMLCLLDAAHRGRLYMWVAPWLHNSISRYTGFYQPIDQLFGSSAIIPTWLGVALALLTVATALVMAEQVFGRKTRRPPGATAPTPAQKSFLWILGPVSFAYVLLLIPRAQMYGLYDRYALCLMPFAIAFVLLLYQRTIGPAVPAVSFILLAIVSLYSVGDAHDYYADMRAGDTAIQELLSAGVPQTSISQSENHDAWLQVFLVGHMHWNGPPALDRGPNPAPLRRFPLVPCSTYAESMTPVVQPDYYIVFSPSPCLQPSKYPPVSYRAWLPPFHRSEYIEQPKYTLP